MAQNAGDVAPNPRHAQPPMGVFYTRRNALSREFVTVSYDCSMETATDSFGVWLLHELDKREWDQADFARALGVRSGVISNWINGVRRPRYESCLDIARALGIDPEIVLERAGRQTASHVRQRPRSLDDIIRELEAERPIAVPIVEQVASAGHGEAAVGYVYLPPLGGRRPKLFAMRVSGTCMEPRLCPGDTIIVDPEKVPEPGKIVVAVAGSDWDKVLVKYFVVDKGRRFLRPEQGRSIPIDETVRIVGVVIRSIRDE